MSVQGQHRAATKVGPGPLLFSALARSIDWLVLLAGWPSVLRLVWLVSVSSRHQLANVVDRSAGLEGHGLDVLGGGCHKVGRRARDGGRGGGRHSSEAGDGVERVPAQAEGETAVDEGLQLTIFQWGAIWMACEACRNSGGGSGQPAQAHVRPTVRLRMVRVAVKGVDRPRPGSRSLDRLVSSVGGPMEA